MHNSRITGDFSPQKKSENHLEKKHRTDIASLTGSEIEELVRELELRQSELEVVIENLRQSNDEAEADVRELKAFYEFTSIGYFTLASDGAICGLNSSGAGMLGRNRTDLINCMFVTFVSPDNRSAFNEFLKKVFQSSSRQICEVRLKIENDISGFIHIEGMVSGENQKCHLTAIDTTDCRLAEETVYNLLNEKELFLKEVHHRVKNNMYNIGALLNMQANIQEDPAAKSVLFDAAGRVQSMSVLYDKLYRSEFTTAVSLKDYFPDLIYEIVGIFPNKKSVKIKTQIDDIILDAKILSILGLLVNELVTNSMKYAFTGRSDGVITVTSSKTEKTVTISIADNGIGIPEDITFKNSTGFGMQLAGMLTEQLSGNIRIERGEGTRFVLEFDISAD